jgi:NADPH:quinone reductase-like Zn-dependent oxidoreductase
VLDAAPVGNALPDLVRIVRSPEHVLTLSDFTTAEKLGVHASFGTDPTSRNDVLGEYAQLASAGRFSVPVARTFPLEDWRTAAELSQSRRAGGKLLLQPGHPK